MKKKYHALAFLFSILILSGCGKVACSYCGEEKFCEEYNILDTTRYICQDCANDPNVTLSSNVVSEYQAAPLDDSFFGIGSDRNKKETSDDNEANADSSAEESSTSDYYDSSENNENNTLESIPETQTSANSNSVGKDEILSRLAPLMSSTNLLLAPGANANEYSVSQSTGDNTDVTIQFNTDSNGKCSLVITKQGKNNIAPFTNSCINASLAFIDSTDYSQTGYEIYNNTCQHDTYTKYGCIFTYKDNENASGSDAFATYTISFQ